MISTLIKIIMIIILAIIVQHENSLTFPPVSPRDSIHWKPVNITELTLLLMYTSVVSKSNNTLHH